MVTPVVSVAGTTGQILVNGAYGPQNGIIVLSLDHSGFFGTSVNGLSGSLTLAGAGTNISVSTNGFNTIYVSGTGIAQASDLVATGGTLYNYVAGSSTNLSGNLALTGQQAWTAAQNNALNLSGNLAATGANLSAVKVTGSSTIQSPNFTGIGGTLVIQSGNFVLISGATSSPSAAVDHGDGINLSGNLFATGANLSAVKVTGSALIQNPNFSGIGGTLVVQSGNFVLISGAPGGSASVDHGDGINLSGNLFTTGSNLSAIKVTGSSIIQVANFSGIGGTSVIRSGSFILISGVTAGAAVVDHGDGINLSGNLALTGQQAWLAANNNGINLSGNLSATGSKLSAVTVTGSSLIQNPNFSGIGGTLVIQSGSFILISGAGGVSSSAADHGDGINLSGNLTLTGQTLIARDLATSGELSTRLLNTGATLIANIASTGQQAWTAANNNGINLSGNVSAISGNLTLTGQTLIARDLATSGELSTRLFNTGATLITAIASTGQQAWTAANSNSINLSGNLFTTGANLSAVKITGSNIVQSPNFTGMGGTLVILSGNFVLISGGAGGAGGAVDHGDGINLSGNLTTTGQTLIARDLATSGELSNRLVSTGLTLLTTIASTGQQAWTAANSNSINLSGNLFTTGANLSAVKVTGSSIIQVANFTGLGTVTVSLISGNLIGISGNNSDSLNLSGVIASTGQQAWNAANNNGINLSGNLTLTGQTLIARDLATSGELSTRLFNTGSQSWNAANNNGINLSGNLTLTGQTAQNNALNLSGNLFITGSNLSAIKVTGSNIIQVANFTGLGGTLIIQSGNFILISGSAAVDHGDGVNLSGQLTLTGQIGRNNALNLSGNLALTGQQAWSAAQNNALNLSGNLFTSGSNLYKLITGLSGQDTLNFASVKIPNSAMPVSGQTSLTQVTETYVNLPTFTGSGLFNIDLMSGTVFNITLSGNVTGFQILDNVVGRVNVFSTFFVQDPTGTRTVNWSFGTKPLTWINGLTPTVPTGSGQASAYSFVSNDGGATYFGFDPQNNIYTQTLNSGALLFGLIASTGQQTWNAANNNGINLSGNISALSGNLTLTGQTLIARDLSLSGELSTRLFNTGATLITTIASTGQQAWSAANNNAINLSGNVSAISGNLTTTGQTLIARDLVTSGELSTRLFTTGATLNTAIIATGQIGQSNALNLSGSLTQTGTQIINIINALSGYSAPANANYVYTTGIQTVVGQKTFLGTTTFYNIVVTGTQTIVNTQEFDVASNFITLNATGGARDAGIFISTGFTGNNATGAVIGFDVPTNRWVFGIQGQNDDLSRLPAIASTGDVYGGDFNLSGNLTQTGVALINRDNSISGGLEARLTLTGATLDTKINALSGSLVATGGILISYANSIGINLSGNLTLTGQTAQNNALNLSGSLFTTGANLSALKVTGSSIIQVPNFTGMGGTLVILSGNFVLISGATAGASAANNGDGINLSGNLFTTGANLSAVKVTGSSIIQSPNFSGMGGTLVIQSGNFVLISGITAGAASPVDHGDGINLSGQLTLTGQTLRNNDLNLSGNLLTTGQTLYNLTVGLSGQANINYASLITPNTGFTVTGNTKLGQVTESYVNVSSGSPTGYYTFDLASGTVFNLVLSGNVTGFQIKNTVPNRVNVFTTFIAQDAVGKRTVVLTSGSFGTGKILKWPNTGTPNAPSVPVLTTGANAIDVFSFMSKDGGNTFYGFVGGQNY